MPTQSPNHIKRRDFLKIAGGAAFAMAGASLFPSYLRRKLLPEGFYEASAADPPPDLYFAGTDGWIHLPPTPPIGFYHPDPLGPQLPVVVSPADQNFTTYIFGFRNVTGMTDIQKNGQKMKAQHSAPMFWVKQYDPGNPVDFRMQLTNLGMQIRPDLFDAHTIHWHGFRNVIPFFDGEPTTSLSVPAGQNFTYIYRPRDPGTYMFHCHVEDVEHVHMGMTGIVWVRPLQDGNMTLYPSGKYAYNDGDGSTNEGMKRRYWRISSITAVCHFVQTTAGN